MHDARPLSYEVLTTRASGKPVSFARIVCAKCGSHADISFNNKAASPDVIEQKLMRMGWQFNKNTSRKNVCPTCNYGWTGKSDVSVEIKDDFNKRKGKDMQTPSVDASLNAIVIFEKLDEVFVNGRFADGWSDERVAKESGNAPKALVIQIREKRFGPIKGDPEIDAIRSEVEVIKAMVSQIEGKMAQAEKRITGR